MKLLVIAPDATHAAPVGEGLADIRPLEMHHAASLDVAELARLKPDCVIIVCADPGRTVLESLRDAAQSTPVPVVMFADRFQPGMAEEAVHAGVAAYIVDGLRPARVQPILEAAMSRFQLVQQLRSDLAKAQSALASRKTIERAKGLLMKERGIGEEDAYALLRKLAMNAGRPIAAIAADLLAFSDVLKGDKS
jgi:response regulator NasT